MRELFERPRVDAVCQRLRESERADEGMRLSPLRIDELPWPSVLCAPAQLEGPLVGGAERGWVCDAVRPRMDKTDDLRKMVAKLLSDERVERIERCEDSRCSGGGGSATAEESVSTALQRYTSLTLTFCFSCGRHAAHSMLARHLECAFALRSLKHGLPQLAIVFVCE